MKILYLEDDSIEVELLQLACERSEPDCELAAAMSRAAFIAALQIGSFDGILSALRLPTPRDCRPSLRGRPARTAAPEVAADRFRPRFLGLTPGPARLVGRLNSDVGDEGT